jgi:hypothetical protein
MRNEKIFNTADTADDSNFIAVNVLADGRCFFRCIATVGLKCLQQAKRCRSGKLMDCRLADMEVTFADEIRQSTVKFLHQNVRELNELAFSMPLLLDKSMKDGPYSSLETRLKMMSRHDEYAGYLEITAVAYILQRPIFIYVRDEQDDNLKLIAKLPPAIAYGKVQWDTRLAINIVHSFDTVDIPGHFDLLLDKKVQLTEDPFNVSSFLSRLDSVDQRTDSLVFVLCMDADDHERGVDTEYEVAQQSQQLANAGAQEGPTPTVTRLDHQPVTTCSGTSIRQSP